MIHVAWFARRVSGPGVDSLDGSSPPLASDDPPRPLRGANPASTHPVQPIETEERANVPEEEEEP